MKPEIVAAIDVGTNSVLCLVARGGLSGPAAILDRCTITRLGQGVDATGALAPEAVSRTLDAVRDHVRAARAAGAERIVAVGTSALRDATNAGTFLSPAAELLGGPVQIISGDEEAELTFAGATFGLDLRGERSVVDIGGGSTELVTGDDEGVDAAVSLDVGSVRLTERLVDHDPGLPEEYEAVRRAVREALEWSKLQLSWRLVGVAGTVTTLLTVHAGITEHSHERIHGTWLSRGHLDALVSRLAALTVAERARLPGMPAGRAGPIVTGGLILTETVSAAGADGLIVSDGGVRYGLVARLLGGPA